MQDSNSRAAHVFQTFYPIHLATILVIAMAAHWLGYVIIHHEAVGSS
jgi:hypothetical protein